MGDRTLTELAWRAFAKGRGLKEAPLAKALAELAKVERAGPEVRTEGPGRGRRSGR
jgi:hypothetical protein